jgi:hypothetical protein
MSQVWCCKDVSLLPLECTSGLNRDWFLLCPQHSIARVEVGTGRADKAGAPGQARDATSKQSDRFRAFSDYLRRHWSATQVSRRDSG